MSYLIVEPDNKYMALQLVAALPKKLVAKATFSSSAEDRPKLVAYFRANLYLLIHSQREGVGNWTKLLRLIGKSDTASIVGILADELERGATTDLMSWQGVMRTLSLSEVAKIIGDRIEQHIAAMRVEVQDLDKLFRLESMKAFQTPRVANTYLTLTNVQLASQATSQIIMNLGQVYDLFKMIDVERLEKDAIRYQLHIALVELFQKFGAPKVGLPDQELITEKNKLSKAALTKLLTAPPAKTQQAKMKSGKKPTATKPETKEAGILDQLQTIFATYAAKDPELVPIAKLVKEARESGKPGAISKLITAILGSRRGHHKKGEAEEEEDGDESLILTKSAFLSVQGSVKDIEAIRASAKWKLDKWQHEMLGHITKGESVLVNGPTSGGKTFVSMAAIDYLLNKLSNIKLAYIAPTFHLALQIYANIKLTFPHAVSLITGVANAIVPNTQVFVGTPSELWAYLLATGDTFNIGIFDEIHTLSTTFGSGKLVQLRAEAISNLLGRCTTQVIALSATIHAADIDVLQEYISGRTGIANIQRVIYTDRPVPLYSYIWDGKTFKEMPKASSTKETLPLPGETKTGSPVTPEASFALLKLMDERDMLPGIFFNELEKGTYDSYVAYIDWVSKEEATNYPAWHRLNEVLGRSIEDYNAASQQYYNEYAEAFGSGSELAIKAVMPRVLQYDTERRVVVDRVKQALGEQILKLLEYKAKYMVPLPEVLAKVAQRLITESKRPITIPAQVPPECRDLLKEYLEFSRLRDVTAEGPERIAALPPVCDSVGPFFRIGDRVREIDDIRSMLNPGKNPASWKLRKQMLALCEAERIRESETEPLFRLISQGLEYGIGIILPTMPFVVQYEMMRLLSKRVLRVVMASQSMGMGINMPIRSVIIALPEERDIDVMTYLQMAGRGGRRRLDDRAYVIAWNVRNAPTAGIATLPRIALPEHGADRGTIITDALSVATQIDLARYSLAGGDPVTVALGMLSTNITGVEEFRMQQGPKRERKEEEGPLPYEFGEPGEEEERKVVKVVKGSRGKVTFDETGFIAAVNSCLSPLAPILGLTPTEMLGITERIRGIAMGQISDEMRLDTYKWAEQFNVVKAALQELHTKFHRMENESFLHYISGVYEILHRSGYRLLRL